MVFPLSLSLHLHVACRKVRNLQIDVDKLVGKVSINLLHHAKSFTCVISIIIVVPTASYAYSL